MRPGTTIPKGSLAILAIFRGHFYFSPEGTDLRWPKVERREGAKRRATLGKQIAYVAKPQQGDPIEACIANDRRADNGSPDLRAQSLDRPRIENADINNFSLSIGFQNREFPKHTLHLSHPAHRSPQKTSLFRRRHTLGIVIQEQNSLNRFRDPLGHILEGRHVRLH